MKYWNKSKKTREQHWHTVRCANAWKVKRELQLKDSSGRFYLNYDSDIIWFEHEKDAVWAALKWS